MPKTKKELDNEYYQNNKERKKEQRRENYKKQKELAEKQKKELEHSLYTAKSVDVLLDLKTYTELSKEKKKLWSDFAWTIDDLNKVGFYDIVQIQKLELVVSNLIRDYYETARGEKRKLESDWKNATEKEQQRLIKYWGLEKARNEKALADKIEEFVKEGESYEKDIEIDKFHQERGKVKCECWKCQEEKKIKEEIKEELREKEPKEKIECGECKKMVAPSSFNEETGACKSCVKRING